jgi:hypothetical protein
MKSVINIRMAVLSALLSTAVFTAVAQTSTVKSVPPKPIAAPQEKQIDYSKPNPLGVVPPADVKIADKKEGAKAISNTPETVTKINPLGLTPPPGMEEIVPPVSTTNNKAQKPGYTEKLNPLNIVPDTEKKSVEVNSNNLTPASDPLGLRAKNGDGPEPPKNQNK